MGHFAPTCAETMTKTHLETWEVTPSFVCMVVSPTAGLRKGAIFESWAVMVDVDVSDMGAMTGLADQAAGSNMSGWYRCCSTRTYIPLWNLDAHEPRCWIYSCGQLNTQTTIRLGTLTKFSHSHGSVRVLRTRPVRRWLWVVGISLYDTLSW